MSRSITLLLSTFLIHLLLIKPSEGYAQNLVSNHSFEEVNFLNVGTRRTQNGYQFREMSIGWITPASSSPDYIVYGNNKNYRFSEYNVKFMDYKPKSGEKSAGISVYGCHKPSGPCREYLQTVLKEPLRIGEEYFVEFWVSRIRNGAVINNIGMYFSEQLPIQTNIEDQGLIPQIMATTPIGTKPFKWEKISGSFTADKAYSFITIGNLFNDNDTQLLDDSNRNKLYAYYFIDQVSVTPLSKSTSHNTSLTSELLSGKTYILDKILFQFGKAIILKESTYELENLLITVRQNLNRKIEITGHTDEVGSVAYNQKLSLQRADAIKAYLVKNGILKQRILTKGMGSSIPISNLDSEKGRKQNRRVEVKLLN